MAYSWLFISALLNGVAQVVWKKGITGETVRNFQGIIQNKFFIFGCLIYGVSIIIWLYVLSKVEVSKAYPILSLSYIFVLVGGLYLGEHITLTRLLGVLCILIGVFIVSKT